MKDVLLVGPFPPPFGGPNVHMWHLRRRLEARGVSCAVLNIGPSRRERRDGVMPMRSAVDFLTKVGRAVRRGCHVHHFFNADHWKATTLAATAAATSRGLGGSYSIGFVGGERQLYLHHPDRVGGRLLRMALRSAQFIVCNNAPVRTRLVALGCDPSRVHAIPSFHSEQVEDVGVIPEPVRRFLDGQGPVLSTIVLPRHESGDPFHEVSLLLAAVGGLVEAYPHIRCVVMGAAEVTDVHLRLAKDAGLEERFHFAGEVPHRDCLAVLRASDVFVRASKRDGTSSSVREALALGTPTVASANPNHPSAAIPFRTGDGADLRAVLQRVLPRVSDLRAELRAGAHELSGGDIERELALFEDVPSRDDRPHRGSRPSGVARR